MSTNIAPHLITAAIVACDPSGVIGLEDRLPWERLEGDLARFKALTMGMPVIMGRKTVATLPCVLKNRYVIELSRTLKEKHNAADVIINTPHSALAAGYIELSKTHTTTAPGTPRYVWVAGGAEIYKALWSELDEIHLTMTHAFYKGDTILPVLKHLVAGDLPDWRLVSSEELSDNTYYVFRRV